MNLEQQVCKVQLREKTKNVCSQGKHLTEKMGDIGNESSPVDCTMMARVGHNSECKVTLKLRLRAHSHPLIMWLDTAEAVLGGHLNQSCLALKNPLCLLQSFNLRLPTRFSFSIWLGLGNAHLLELVET